MTTNAWNSSIFFSFSDFLFIRYGQVNIEEYVIHVKANSYIAYYNGIPLWKLSIHGREKLMQKPISLYFEVSDASV